MEIHYLRHAVAVANYESISKAAKYLHMAQPNLSNSIKTLETDLGIRIFIRNSKGVQLTEEGKEFIIYAESILQQIDSLEARYFTQQDETIRIRMSVARSSHLAMLLINYLKKITLPYTVHFKETTAFEVINDVASGVSEIGVTKYSNSQKEYFTQLANRKNLIIEPFAKHQSVLLMSQNHPLANSKRITLEMLSEFTEIIHGDFKEPISLTPSRLANNMVPTKNKIFIYDRGSLMLFLSQMNDTFMWTANTNQGLLNNYGLVEKNCQEVDSKLYDAFIYPKNKLLSNECKEIKSLIKEQAKKNFI